MSKTPPLEITTLGGLSIRPDLSEVHEVFQQVGLTPIKLEKIGGTTRTGQPVSHQSPPLSMLGFMGFVVAMMVQGGYLRQMVAYALQVEDDGPVGLVETVLDQAVEHTARLYRHDEVGVRVDEPYLLGLDVVGDAVARVAHDRDLRQHP